MTSKTASEDASKPPPLPDGYEKTSERLIIPSGSLPLDVQTTVAISEEVIADHLEKYLQREDNKAATTVWSDILGGIHVYVFPPSQSLGRNWYTLCTMGVSGTKMNVPMGIAQPELFQRCELLCYLPSTWQFPGVSSPAGVAPTSRDWPLKMLKSLGNYVSTTGAWLGEDHGIPSLTSDTPGLPFCEDTKLSATVLLSPLLESPEFHRCEVGSEVVNFFLVTPVTSAEAQWKRDVGIANSLYHVIGDKANWPEIPVGYIIDPHRPCTVSDLHFDERIAAFAEDGSEGEETRAERNSEDEETGADHGDGDVWC